MGQLDCGPHAAHVLVIRAFYSYRASMGYGGARQGASALS